MKVSILLWAMSMSFASAQWRVDNRCLQEGQMLVGDAVDEMLQIDDKSFEAVTLDDEYFKWDDLTYFDLEDEDVEDEATPSLRGSSASFFRNETAMFSNVTRNLQSGRDFNLKLTWTRGACWQGTVEEEGTPLKILVSCL